MAFADAGDYDLEPLAAEPRDTALRRYPAQLEDLFWSANYWKEHYFRADCDYEDYAPAYCVGYSGCAQYGGSFADSELSLRANFIRIKGDSRLSWEDAIEPIRAAWQRIEAVRALTADMELGRVPDRASQESCCV